MVLLGSSSFGTISDSSIIILHNFIVIVKLRDILKRHFFYATMVSYQYLCLQHLKVVVVVYCAKRSTASFFLVRSKIKKTNLINIIIIVGIGWENRKLRWIGWESNV